MGKIDLLSLKKKIDISMTVKKPRLSNETDDITHFESIKKKNLSIIFENPDEYAKIDFNADTMQHIFFLPLFKPNIKFSNLQNINEIDFLDTLNHPSSLSLPFKLFKRTIFYSTIIYNDSVYDWISNYLDYVDAYGLLFNIKDVDGIDINKLVFCLTKAMKLFKLILLIKLKDFHFFSALSQKLSSCKFMINLTEPDSTFEFINVKYLRSLNFFGTMISLKYFNNINKKFTNDDDNYKEKQTSEGILDRFKQYVHQCFLFSLTFQYNLAISDFTDFNEIHTLIKIMDPIVHKARNKLNLIFDLVDVLQLPLDTITTRLSQNSYLEMQADRKKYMLYTEAAFQRFIEILQKCIDKHDIYNCFKLEEKTNLSENNAQVILNDKIHVVYFGSGPGPIFDSLFKKFASSTMKFYKNDGILYLSYLFEHTEYRFEIYFTVIEKNINACQDLFWKKKNLARDSKLFLWEYVDIVVDDVRNWQPKVLINLIISELLGSFGDNELCPECFVNLPKILHPDNCFVIPSTYTNFLTPISSNKLYSDLKEIKNGYDCAYVCNVHTYAIVAPPKKCFIFDHEFNTDYVEELNQSAEIVWDVEQQTYVHGFLGYFKAELSKKIVISNMQLNPNCCMGSWFPLFFPIEKTIELKENDSLKLEIHRRSSNKETYYEWVAYKNDSFVCFQNSQGKYWTLPHY